MPYKTLTEGKGWLRSETSTLDPELKARAEQFADREIDRLFWDWTRTTWTGSAVPWEIADIAELLGAGHYLEIATLSPASMPVDAVMTGPMLKRKGYEMAERVKMDGGPLAADGTYRTGPSRDEDRDLFVEIEPV